MTLLLEISYNKIIQSIQCRFFSCFVSKPEFKRHFEQLLLFKNYNFPCFHFVPENVNDAIL